MKARVLNANKKSVKIQSLIRRFLQRCKFVKRHKRLIRDRNNRNNKKQNLSAIKIQKIVRYHLSKKVYRKRRIDKKEEDRVTKKFQELEKQLEGKLGRIYFFLHIFFYFFIFQFFCMYFFLL